METWPIQHPDLHFNNRIKEGEFSVGIYSATYEGQHVYVRHARDKESQKDLYAHLTTSLFLRTVGQIPDITYLQDDTLLTEDAGEDLLHINQQPDTQPAFNTYIDAHLIKALVGDKDTFPDNFTVDADQYRPIDFGASFFTNNSYRSPYDLSASVARKAESTLRMADHNPPCITPEQIYERLLQVAEPLDMENIMNNVTSTSTVETLASYEHREPYQIIERHSRLLSSLPSPSKQRQTG